MKRLFEERFLAEDCVFIASPTLFGADLDKKNETFFIKGGSSTGLRYRNMVSGCAGMSVIVTIGGGSSTRLEISIKMILYNRGFHLIYAYRVRLRYLLSNRSKKIAEHTSV